jgi:hypothetical protein
MTSLVAHLDRTAGSRRSALIGALALTGVAVIHLLDGPGSLEEVSYVGWLELILVAAVVPLALMLVIRPSRDVWIAAAGVSWAALGMYMASRTIGLPGMSDDIGSWGQTLGVLNVVAQVGFVALAVHAVRHSH